MTSASIILLVCKEVYAPKETVSVPVYGKGNFTKVDIDTRIAQLQDIKGFTQSDIKMTIV
jgi:hypothetical protein